jgi:hypothetical protein
MDEALHFPGQEPEAPAPEAQPEPTPEVEPAPETPPEPTPETPEVEPETPETPEVPLKKRSIYDDYQDKKQEAKDYRNVAVAALQAQGIELSGKETPAQLQDLMQKHKTPDAPTPPAPAPSAPTDELEEYAKEHGLDAPALARLAEVLGKRIPPAQLSQADRQELETLKGWKATKDAEEQRAAEDREVLATAPTIKAQLEIHDDAELDTVMKEIVRLSHTKEFADKEVDYIVWKKKAELSKLVSPKKPSFESGGSPAEAATEVEPNFSAGKGITPAMAQAASQSRGQSALEIRKGT